MNPPCIETTRALEVRKMTFNPDQSRLYFKTAAGERSDLLFVNKIKSKAILVVF